MDRVKEVYKVTIAGSIINVVLLVLKFAAGILGHSAAMIADAIHSLTDFATDVVVLVFVKLGNKPMDKDHDYGHGIRNACHSYHRNLAFRGGCDDLLFGRY